MMRKRLFVYICILVGSLVSCGKRSVPVFADADVLARSLYEKAGFETDAIYAEEVEDTDAFLFGVTVSDFDEMVDDAVCYRKLVDSNGQMMYLFDMESEDQAISFAKAFFEHYEFAPCDVAEKMTVISAGHYVIFFKSDAHEVDTAVEAFRALMDGRIDFQKEQFNRG